MERDTTSADGAPVADDLFTEDELEALEALARFEIEHRRILAMQALYYKRSKYGTA